MPRSRALPAVLAAAALALLAALAVHLRAQAVPTPPNYDDAAAWLCRPGRADACAAPATATIVEPDGRGRVETYAPDPAAPIDCFYVYPTVSRARGANAPIAATDAEIGAVRLQLARFTTVCRPFAPLYRQITSLGLRDVLKDPNPSRPERLIAYSDVLAAWRSYLAKDNAGRRVVLIGHSQGAKFLARLMAEEIDGKPVQARLVSAIIPGTEVDVPEGQVVGGTFKHIPLCRAATETGCVIAYSTYPADKPIPPDAMFGAAHAAGMRYACVDPVALDGAKTLDADLPPPPEAKLGTEFATIPGALTARCKTDGAFSVLAVGADPANPAAAQIEARVERQAEYLPRTGLHTFDINLVLGNLVDLVRKQSAAER